MQFYPEIFDNHLGPIQNVNSYSYDLFPQLELVSSIHNSSFSPEILHGIFHLCISECIDDRVQHGGDDCVEHSHKLIFSEAGGWSQIKEGGRSKKQDNHCDV